MAKMSANTYKFFIKIHLHISFLYIFAKKPFPA
jgi:hypothetical protein